MFVTFLLLEITLDSLLPLIVRKKTGKEQQFSSPLMSSSPLPLLSQSGLLRVLERAAQAGVAFVILLQPSESWD